MTLDDYIDDYSFAPFTDAEFAYGAVKVKEEGNLEALRLVAAAQAYLNARDQFLDILNELGVEMG